MEGTAMSDASLCKSTFASVKGQTPESRPAGQVIISCDAFDGLKQYLIDSGREVVEFGPIDNVAGPVRKHPDLVFCKLGPGKVFEGDPGKLSPKYPGDVIYNGCSTGKYFIHNLKYTDPGLLDSAREAGLELINVRQGYGRCSILPIDEDSIITYDKGIAIVCEDAGLNVLRVAPGHVALPGYDEGFIGGTAGRVGDEILFNGDLSAHPDFGTIRDFIEERGLTIRYFKGWPLTDIGSVIEV